MALPDLFSRRKRSQERTGTDVYQYEKMPPAARVQFCQIMQDAIGPYGEGSYDTTPGARVYNELVRLMRREKAVFVLPPSGGTFSEPDKEFFNWFLNEADNNRVLDAVELACRALEVIVEPDEFHFREYVKTATKDAISELNARFLESGFGYQYASGQVIRIDSQFVHGEIVVPALAVLSGKAYRSAEKEFLAAHSAYRDQDYEACLVECGKAFESVLKVIAAERGWAVQANDPAKKLLDAAYAAGFIDPVLQAEFTALRGLLESSVPVLRNKMAGHGAGQVTRNVPRHFASLQLHQTAAMILFLADHHSQNP
jgi:hypothetical protein